jgi:hypothetical protein
MSTQSITLRPDGKGYIDEEIPVPDFASAGQFDDAELSGSSEEEEEDEGDAQWSEVGELPDTEVRTAREGDDWEVEDEDWELAHGGMVHTVIG